MRARGSRLRSQGGQAITEAVLIIALLMAVTFTVGRVFRDEEIFRHMISDPWQSLAGMLQNGIWGPPSKTNNRHPAAHSRHIVITGESPR